MVSLADGVLLCPQCRGDYLHHGDVTVFSRDEDEPQVTKTRVCGSVRTSLVVASQGSGNPSDRRDGIAIRFSCEHCGAHPELTIAQHKGSSLVEWRTCKF